MASHCAKCMTAKAMQKGLDGAVAGDDVDACAAEVDFNKDLNELGIAELSSDYLLS